MLCLALSLLAACSDDGRFLSPQADPSRLNLDQAYAMPRGDAPPRDWAIADINHNGEPDLVVLEGSGATAHLRVITDLLTRDADGVGGVEHGPSDDMQVGQFDGGLALGDFNGDGATDVLIAGVDRIFLLRGEGDTVSSTPVALPLGQLVLRGAIAAGDINQDGYTDLAALVGSPDVVVWLGGPDGINGVALTTIANQRAIAMADLDGDGDDDVVSDCGGDLCVSEASGGGLLAPRLFFLGAASPLLARVPDVDGDGDEEIAARVTSPITPGGGHTFVWLGEPGAVPGQPIELPDPGGSAIPRVGDLDLDGHPDVVVMTDQDPPQLLAFRGSATAFSASQTSVLPTPDPSRLQPEVQVIPGALLTVLGRGDSPTLRVIPALSPDVDLDGDGFGCGVDPDDARADVWPGAPEVPANGTDEDGDGWDLCGLDEDLDGFSAGPIPTIGGCDQNELMTDLAATDCNDQNSTVNPNAIDIPGLPTDMNCDGMVRCWQDLDLDGYGGFDLALPGDADCEDPGEAPYGQADCDDTNPAIHPGATGQVGEGFDVNCDGRVACYLDVDGDGARSAEWHASAAVRCDNPGEALAIAPYDCDDADDSVFTGAPEVIADGKDQNCDGADLCFNDVGGRARSDDLDCTDEGESSVKTSAPQAPEGCETARGSLLAALAGLLLRRRR